MNLFKDKQKRKIYIGCTSILVVIAVIFSVYINDYYRADSKSIAAFASVDNISKKMIDEHTIVYAPEDATTGLIFYPGGKVEYTAYEPLTKACASKGILCVLVEMPFNLAVLDTNAADGIQEQFSEIENWYIGGHSLGGSMASFYLADHTDAYEGLILLGSYSTTDLSQADIDVLSIFGSEDMVLNQDKYNKNKSNLPADFTEKMIEGGCHAYFGMYGAQDGDGTPTISNAEQINITADTILQFIQDSKEES